jgi:hypothetical protein
MNEDTTKTFDASAKTETLPGGEIPAGQTACAECGAPDPEYRGAALNYTHPRKYALVCRACDAIDEEEDLPTVKARIGEPVPAGRTPDETTEEILTLLGVI